MATPLMELFGGLILLVIAADWLVDGAVVVARRFGLSMMVVGLTIVAYGTSFPEFVVSVLASQRGVADFAVGNILGSNVANIGLVLGATALIAPFAVHNQTLFRRELPILFAVTGGSVLTFMDDVIERWEGLVLLAVAVIVTIVSLRSPGDPDEVSEDAEIAKAPIGKAVVLVVVGIAGLVAGAHFMVDGGSDIAHQLGISHRVVGLTVVAVGTSLPELAASIASAIKGHPELAVGNVVGSCLFNLAFVMGSASAISPLHVSLYDVRFDLIAMVGLTAIMWFTLRTGRKLSRPEGAFLMTLYAGFLTWIVLTTTGVIVV